MSISAFINFFGLNFPCLIEDVDGDLGYEHTLVPFVGCSEDDFTEFNGITKVLAHLQPKITGNTLVLVKQQVQEDDGKLLFLYSFPIMDGGEFGAFPDTINPEAVYKFSSGNPDSGYFYDMLFVLQKDIKYEVLYHSEVLSKITKITLHWDSSREFVSVSHSVIM